MRNDKMKRRKKKDKSRARGIHANGDFINPGMSAGAELHPSTFRHQIPDENLPASWFERAGMAWKYYQEEPYVNNIINMWRVFAIGDEILIRCDDDDAQTEARDFACQMKLNSLVKDMILGLLVKGECVAVKMRDLKTGALKEIVCVNPISVEAKYEDGKLVDLKQYTDKIGSEPITFSLDRVFHNRWNTGLGNERGCSMVVAAFRPIALLKDLRKAERAAAKRLISPLRFIQVGGQFGNKTIIPDQKMMNNIRDAINKMDPNAGLVVPFYVKVQTEGAEGKVLHTEKMSSQYKDDICIALGVPKSVVTCDDANFATTKLALEKVVVQLKEIKQVARDILNWIFDEWLEHNGYEDKTISYIFNDLDLTNEIGIKNLYLDLFDRGVVSRETMQHKMGFNPKIENAHIERESKEPIDYRNAETVIGLIKQGIMSIEQAMELYGLDEEGKHRKT